jgi:chromate reductase, NAD(P)H dehydrogenase (quinone)
VLTILAVSGSLRSTSSNTACLQAIGLLAPPGVTLVLFDGLGGLPHFNPDLDGDEKPAPVAAFRALVERADGLLISSPEYARGVPGSLKNGLDWLVSGPEFPGKPVALINTSPRATHAQASLALTLTTMSARLVEKAALTLPLLGKAWTAQDIASDPEFAASLRRALRALVETIVAGRSLAQ